MASTNLIVHEGIANVSHRADKPLCILGVFEEIREFLLSCLEAASGQQHPGRSDGRDDRVGCHRVHDLANLFQFPGSLMRQPQLSIFENVDSPFQFFCSLLLTSFGGIGSESDLESALTWGAKNSMAISFTSVHWNGREHCRSNVREGGAIPRKFPG